MQRSNRKSTWLIAGLLGLLALPCLSYADDSDITKFGAVGDGKTLNSVAIQKANR